MLRPSSDDTSLANDGPSAEGPSERAGDVHSKRRSSPSKPASSPRAASRQGRQHKRALTTDLLLRRFAFVLVSLLVCAGFTNLTRAAGVLAGHIHTVAAQGTSAKSEGRAIVPLHHRRSGAVPVAEDLRALESDADKDCQAFDLQGEPLLAVAPPVSLEGVPCPPRCVAQVEPSWFVVDTGFPRGPPV